MYILSQIWCFKGDLKKRYGEWVVITGATDGIGLAMARWFARKGHSLVLIGRNSSKLLAAQELLENEPNVGEIIKIQIDLSNSSPENFESILGKLDLAKRDIGILVNNAGLFPGQLKRFHRFELPYLREIVNVNILAPVYMTNLLLPGMLERKKGLIVNVSSLISKTSGQYYSVYSPTKVFLNAFSKLLSAEYYKHPIDVVTLTPGMVSTKAMNALAPPGAMSFFCPTPEVYANTALNALSTRISQYSGTMRHAIFSLGLNEGPSSRLNALIGDKITRMSGLNLDLSPEKQQRTREDP